MNERILKLLKQSGLQPYYDAQEGQIEKFAELIVRECAERLLNDVKLTDIQTTRCVASIREHFGIEE